MIETLAVVTFLLANGTHAVVPVFPPGGDYHPRFEFMCRNNRPLVVEQVRTLFKDRKVAQPDGAEKILSIKVYCSPTMKT